MANRQNEKLLVFEPFLLLSQSFQKSTTAEVSESIYMWERIYLIELCFE